MYRGTSRWQRTTGVGPLLQNCRSRYWRILSFFEREISDRSKELIFIPYDTPDQQADCTKTSPSRRPFSWLKTSLAQTSSTKCVLRVEYTGVRFLYQVRSANVASAWGCPTSSRECMYWREIGSKLSDIQSTECITTNERVPSVAQWKDVRFTRSGHGFDP